LQPRHLVVIGGSAGSLEALNIIVSGLPAMFPATVLVVLHVSADSPGMLGTLLSRKGPLPAMGASDAEPLRSGHIYVARPDHHLTIEDGVIRVLRGPRENRHRPAIDPLFRTAAREYGPRVVGVILSGLMDDGSAGLFAVKQRKGIAIVQDPEDALWDEMPAQAIAYAKPDYILPVRAIAPALVELVYAAKGETAVAKKGPSSRKSNGRRRKKRDLSAALGGAEANETVAYPDEGEGAPSVFACPECHGVLWELKNGKMVRFRCRVGHSYGTESLTRELSMASESALWAAVRALEEKSAMQRRMAEGMGRETVMGKRMIDQCSADSANARLIRDMIFRRDAELESGKVESEAPDEEEVA
jgi:two-component system, chemotaxis family, protein-glutamate methylesterase/glutaminase